MTSGGEDVTSIGMAFTAAVGKGMAVSLFMTGNSSQIGTIQCYSLDDMIRMRKVHSLADLRSVGVHVIMEFNAPLLEKYSGVNMVTS